MWIVERTEANDGTTEYFGPFPSHHAAWEWIEKEGNKCRNCNADLPAKAVIPRCPSRLSTLCQELYSYWAASVNPVTPPVFIP